MWRRARPFAVVALAGIAVGIAPYDPPFPEWTLAGLALVPLMAAAIAWLPWGRMPRGASPLTSLMSVMIISLLMLGQGRVDPALVPLLIIPILWQSLYGRPWEAAFAVALSALALGVLGQVFPDGGSLTQGGLRLPAIRADVAILIGLSIFALRSDLVAAVFTRDRVIGDVKALAAASRDLYGSVDPNTVVASALAAAVRLVGRGAGVPLRASLMVVAGDTVLERHTTDDADGGATVLRSFPLGDAPALPAVLILADATAADSHALGIAVGGPATLAIAAPLRVDETQRGALIVHGRGDEGYTVGEMEQLAALAAILELALSRAVRHVNDTTTDVMTGLPNRRAFERRLASMTPDRVYAVLSIDVDGLKEMNDAHGHGAGDELLQRVAKTLSAAIRRDDVLIRMGGDEFLAVLDSAGSAACRRVAERMVEDVGSLVIHGERAGISVGCATVAKGQDPSARVRESDAALYVAKRAGGNRAVMAGDTALPMTPVEIVGTVVEV